MVEKLFLPELPASPMFEGSTSVMTTEWQEFFRTLFNRVGGTETTNLSDSNVDLVAQTYSTPKDYGKRIDELEIKLNSLPAPKSYDQAIDELDQAIHSVPSFRYKIQIPIVMDYFDAVPARGTESNWHGGLLALATGQPLDAVPTDIVVTKGIGKIVVVVNAGTDLVGDITLTGDTADRSTGVITAADTDTLSIDALTTDNTTTDSNGNTVHSFVGAYISSKWFTGSVTLSTADLTLTDVDVYHISFEQVNDSPNLIINTLDANIFTLNVNAEFDAYLYTVHVAGSKCNIDNEADIHVGADGETAIVNKYWRLRRGDIDEDLDGTTDGFWVDVHYANSPVYVEDVTVSVWLTKTIIVG